jgi:hypothetical protein
MSQTTQTAQTETAQGTHHYVLTLEMPGRASGSWYGTVTPSPNATRHDVLTHLMGQIRSENPEFTRANVIFFSFEPNQI